MINKILEDNPLPAKETEDHILDTLLDEINTIGDSGIRSFTRAILLAAPDWFWKAPSTLDDGQFFEDELGEGGLIVHLKRVMRVFDLLAISAILAPEERDLGKAAVLIGQLDRYHEDEDGKLTYNLWNAFSVGSKIDKIIEFNNLWAKDGSSNTLSISNELIDRLKRLIRVQDGRWTKVQEVRPRDTLELMYHQALYVGSGLRWLVEDDASYFDLQ